MRRALLTVLSAIALVATGVVGALAVGGTGTVDPPPRIAFLANGIVPADALAAGGIAGQLGAPLFTTPATSLNTDARDGIKAYAPDLVIVLGGPVAINESVVDALATATGLTKTSATNPTSGIVRAAGGDRFATARAVADLLAAYNPAYLPVDATALGAIDADTATTAGSADTAGDSDLLDGMDSTDFALSDRSCDPGEVVTEIDADGELVCAPDQDEIDGGDAETLDGLDSTDLLRVIGHGTADRFGTATDAVAGAIQYEGNPSVGINCYSLLNGMTDEDVMVIATQDWADSGVGDDERGAVTWASHFNVCPDDQVEIRTFTMSFDGDGDVNGREPTDRVGYAFIVTPRAPTAAPRDAASGPK